MLICGVALTIYWYSHVFTFTVRGQGVSNIQGTAPESVLVRSLAAHGHPIKTVPDVILDVVGPKCKSTTQLGFESLQNRLQLGDLVYNL